jgi:transcription termination factor Rho
MDEVIFQEFKGTGNTEILLDRQLFERRVFPCIDINSTGTRKEERIFAPDWLPKVYVLRRALSQMGTVDAVEALLKKLSSFDSNQEFLDSLAG